MTDENNRVPLTAEAAADICSDNPDLDLEDRGSARFERAIEVAIAAVAGVVIVGKVVDELKNKKDGFVEARKGVYVPWDIATSTEKIAGHYRRVAGQKFDLVPDSKADPITDRLAPVDGDYYINLEKVFEGNEQLQSRYAKYCWIHVQKKTLIDNHDVERRATVFRYSDNPEALEELKDYNRRKRKSPESVEPGIHKRLFPHRLPDMLALRLAVDLRDNPTSDESIPE